MSVLVRSCGANIALSTVIAMTVTAIFPAAQILAQPTDKGAHSAVNLPVLTLASLESSLAAVDAAVQPTVTSPREATQAVAPAAADPGDLLYDLAQAVAYVVAIALTPLWFVAAPITFPIGFAIGQALYPPEKVNYFTAWLPAIAGPFLPVVLVLALFPARPLSSAATPAPSASAARSSAASPVNPSGTPPVSADEHAIQLKVVSESVKPAALRSKRLAKSAAAVVSTEASEKRDDASALSKGNAASSRHAAGRSGVKDEARQRS